MPKAHVIQVVVKGEIGNEDYRNIIHFGTDVVIADGDYPVALNTLAGEVMETYVEHLLPRLASTFRLDGVAAKRIFPALTDESFNNTGTNVGGNAGDSLPSFNSIVIDMKTGGGGRRNRGRIKLPPPVHTEAIENELTSAARDLYQAFADDLFTKFGGLAGTSDFEIGVLSRAAVAGGATIGNAFKSATTLTALTLIGMQGKRKVGRGS